MDTNVTTSNPKTPAVILTSPDDLRTARLNQPQVSLAELQANEDQHRLAAERFADGGKSETSKTGREEAALDRGLGCPSEEF